MTQLCHLKLEKRQPECGGEVKGWGLYYFTCTADLLSVRTCVCMSVVTAIAHI